MLHYCNTLSLQVTSGLQTDTPETARAGQLTVLPVLLSGVLPYVESDGLALEAFMGAQGDPQGDPQGEGSEQHIWAADHVEVSLQETHHKNILLGMYGKSFMDQ